MCDDVVCVEIVVFGLFWFIGIGGNGLFSEV